MARGKRAESNGVDAAKRLQEEQDKHQQEVQAEASDEGEAATEDEPGVGHNGPAELSEDQRIALTFQHKRAYEVALAAKKAADAALKNTCKLAKAELGPDAVSDIKHIIELETEDGEAKFKAKVEREVRIARWMGLPVGANGSLFDEIDRTPGVERAAAAGKRLGLAGERCDNPHDPSTEQYTAFMTGYAEGQRTMFSIKPLESDAVEFDSLAPAEEPPAPEGVSLG